MRVDMCEREIYVLLMVVVTVVETQHAGVDVVTVVVEWQDQSEWWEGKTLSSSSSVNGKFD